MERSVAVLGATSQLALDFIGEAVAAGEFPLSLYARRPDAAEVALSRRGIRLTSAVKTPDRFGDLDYQAVLNFIGVGDPALAIAMGAEIFALTRSWDDIVLDYVHGRPETAYVFLSSGAVYGEVFDTPVTSQTTARYPINNLGPEHWYGLAKLAAETRHRAEAGSTVIDVRIFNYVSRHMHAGSRFLLTDMLRCALNGEIFETRDEPLVRDYLEPRGLYALLRACICAPAGTNRPVDAYTSAPISKAELLALLQREFGLRFRLVPALTGLNATGTKRYYHSLSRAAAEIGYEPLFTSAEAILNEMRGMLN